MKIDAHSLFCSTIHPPRAVLTVQTDMVSYREFVKSKMGTHDITYHLLALVGEIGELLMVSDMPEKKLDEAGDCKWYFTAIDVCLREMGEPGFLAELNAAEKGRRVYVNTDRYDEQLVYQAGALAAHAMLLANGLKKVIGHGRDVKSLVAQVVILHELFVQYCYMGGVSLDYAIVRNIQKLDARYPDGFSIEASKNRVD